MIVSGPVAQVVRGCAIFADCDEEALGRILLAIKPHNVRHASPRHASPSHASPRHAIPRHAAPRLAAPRLATRSLASPRHAMRQLSMPSQVPGNEFILREGELRKCIYIVIAGEVEVPPPIQRL